jgi:hypothetical protein
MASIPAAWAVYFVSRNSSDNSQPFFTRMIDGYTETSEKWSKRNDLHVRMIEQAGEDRVLFQNTRPYEHVEMKFPEYVDPRLIDSPSGVARRTHDYVANNRRIMNVGSPFNVPAGSQVSMEKVIEKYKKIAYEDNERKLEALKNNQIKSEQPFDKAYLRKAPGGAV